MKRAKEKNGRKKKERRGTELVHYFSKKTEKEIYDRVMARGVCERLPYFFLFKKNGIQKNHDAREMLYMLVQGRAHSF